MRLLGLVLLLLLTATVQAAAQDDAKAPFKCGPKAAKQQVLKAPQHADAVPEGMTEYTLSGSRASSTTNRRTTTRTFIATAATT